jgi:hypothetical protein
MALAQQGAIADDWVPRFPILKPIGCRRSQPISFAATSP